MKFNRISKLVLLVLLSIIMAMFTAACATTPVAPPAEPPEQNTPSTPDPTPDPAPDPDPADKVIYDSAFMPTSFDKATVSYQITQLGDGVRMVKNSYTRKANSKPVVVYAIEVDLTKAAINAGSNNNSIADAFKAKQVPYAQMQAFERDNQGVKVIAATNADFFGGNVSVNAFVKNGVIIKAGHNDNGNYDYKNNVSDVPASAPLLFGVKGDSAQIAPIIKYTGDISTAAVKEGVIKSQLFYGGVFSASEATHTIKNNIAPYDETKAAVYIDDTTKQFQARSRSTVITLKLSQTSAATVLSTRNLTAAESLSPQDGQALLVAHPDYAKIADIKKVAPNATYQTQVASEDSTWNGYNTILGCRQALILDGEIVDTVTKENTNGAQTTNIPRTAVGIKANGKVVLFSVEALTYGKLGSDTDTVGLNLPELADFIRYYNCVSSANFDGGGSTQLIVRGAANGSGDPSVIVRSSDTAKTELGSSRTVINTFLITTKK